MPSGNVRLTLVFPTKWDTELTKFDGDAKFSAVVTELGYLAAADANLEQEIFDALCYLINKDDHGAAVGLVQDQIWNSFEKRKELLRVLHNAKVTEQIRQTELTEILTDATRWHKRRNEHVHARWCIADTTSEVVRLKFDAKSQRDKIEPIKPNDLHEIAIHLEDCTSRLRTHLLATFLDYEDWLTKRLPPIPSLTGSTQTKRKESTR
jgi:hypothetical protein